MRCVVALVYSVVFSFLFHFMTWMRQASVNWNNILALQDNFAVPASLYLVVSPLSKSKIISHY